MDKRLSIYDVVLIAKATVESKTDVQRLASALVGGLQKQEIARVKRHSDYLGRELENLIEGRPTSEGLEYVGHTADDIVELATDMPRNEVAEAASFENRKRKPTDRTYMKPRGGSDEPTY